VSLKQLKILIKCLEILPTINYIIFFVQNKFVCKAIDCKKHNFRASVGNKVDRKYVYACQQIKQKALNKFEFCSRG
jgi:hypothetical protein